MTAKVGKSSNRGSKPGEKRGGRKKGTPNKTTAQLKESILRAFDTLGGEQWLVDTLAAKDPGSFASLLKAILPKDIKAEVTPSESFAQIVIEAWKSGRSS